MLFEAQIEKIVIGRGIGDGGSGGGLIVTVTGGGDGAIVGSNEELDKTSE